VGGGQIGQLPQPFPDLFLWSVLIQWESWGRIGGGHAESWLSAGCWLLLAHPYWTTQTYSGGKKSVTGYQLELNGECPWQIDRSGSIIDVDVCIINIITDVHVHGSIDTTVPTPARISVWENWWRETLCFIAFSMLGAGRWECFTCTDLRWLSSRSGIGYVRPYFFVRVLCLVCHAYRRHGTAHFYLCRSCSSANR